MGTDIHMAAEWYDREAKQWRAAFIRQGRRGETALIRFDRNYDAFAILADVRNGTGFGGCVTGSGFVPIAVPRGVPDDISHEALAALSDEHTPSWIGLDELMAYDWTQTTTKSGWITAPEFYRWDSIKEWWPAPNSYCGDVSGDSVIKVSEEKMRAAVIGAADSERKEAALKALSNLYCQVSWPVAYAEASGELWQTIVPRLLRLAAEKGLSHGEVRLVFDFDS